MNYYAFYCEDAPNSLETRKSVRPAHLARLQALSNEDRLLTAGPLIQDNGIVSGSLIVAKFESLDQAKKWIAADPFVTEKVYQKMTVTLFQAVQLPPSTIALIEKKLISALNPSVILVKDDREEHIGHAHENSGHFTVKITSDLFSGKNAIARHRLIYQALGSLMQTHIHALKIEACSPSDEI